ncbi:MAG: RpiB/LacA/LacB family sugar-phosphate isomerase, partial [Bacteroidetes bacterium]|nr:RpiB/LacA/LacB family sugar-phosphate isomerase [Bacteroidota bacterium]
ESVEQGEAAFGILLCGSANGVCMTANKHQHIRAALCWETEVAKLVRQHNNANIICLPARFIALEFAKSLVEIFMNTSFEGGRHEKRIEKMMCV